MAVSSRLDGVLNVLMLSAVTWMKTEHMISETSSEVICIVIYQLVTITCTWCLLLYIIHRLYFKQGNFTGGIG